MAVGAGIFYALVGILFAVPTTHAKAWRWAAWVVSGLAYGGHIVHERIRLGSAPVVAAWHVALGAAVGAFGLAVGANVHSLLVESTSEQHRLLLLSLVLFPVLTAVPAFVVAFVAAVVLGRMRT
jgi:hypothetical protein